MSARIRVPAVFVRGGTSRAILFREDALAEYDDRQREAIILAAMGSPDPYGRQVDGLGGGISSLSKAAIIGVRDGEVTYKFGQVDVGQPIVEFAGTCGNISSAVGPFALTEGLVPCPRGGEAVVPVVSTNIEQRFLAHVPVRGGEVAEEGDYEIDGVPGTGAPIGLEFLEPGGSRGRGVLPTGQVVDEVRLSDGAIVRVSVVDVMNPAVFAWAADLGMRGTETPLAIDADTALTARLEEIRRFAATAFGLAGATARGIPKVAVVAPPAEYTTSRGRTLGAGETSLIVRALSMGLTHRTVPLTMAVCLAGAARIEGTVVQEAFRQVAGLPGGSGEGAPVRIGHPAGVIDISAKVSRGAAGWVVESATAYRTARRILEGQVLVPESALRGRAWYRAAEKPALAGTPAGD